jgi:signal transduction histidine kinase/AmiR/NasT family two-component response regulator
VNDRVRPRWLSFRAKTILGIGLIELVLLGLLIWSSQRFLSQAQIDALLERATSTAEQFAILAQDAVLSEDLAALHSFADGVMQDLDLVYLRVVGYREELLERGDADALARPFRADSAATARSPEDGVFDARADITVGGMTFGRIEVGVDASRGSALIQMARERLLVIAVTEIALVALFSFLLGTYLTGALERLRKAADTMTEGGVGVQVPVSGEDEIAATMQAFNRMSARLKASLDALEQARQEAEQAAVESAQASAEAARANAAKSQFLAHMSHELRTPLNAVIGILQLSEDWTLPAVQHEQLDVAKQAGHSLLELINNVLDLSKIEAGELSLHEGPTRFEPLLLAAADILRPLAQVKGIRLLLDLDAPLPAVVSMDAVRFRQVLINLMGNAVKFTDTGEVRLRVVRLCAGGEACHRLRFEVIDTGVGIAPERQDVLFKEFSQVSEQDGGRRGGAGLGLAISQRIIRLMGGEIRVDSRVGAGSRFWFELTLKLLQDRVPQVPVNLVQQEPVGPTPQTSPNPPDRDRPKTCAISPELSPEIRRDTLPVLLVDDVQTNRLIASAMLKKAGYQVEQAANGAEALEAICRGPVGSVLMDIEMPVLNGIDTTQRIRALSEPLCRIPIIAMTAHAFQDERDRCLDAGMDGFITKPIAREELTDLVAQWHGRFRLDGELSTNTEERE